MALPHCKLSTHARTALGLAACGLLALAACSAPLHHLVSLQTLEETRPADATPLGQIALAEQVVGGDFSPLGQRLALCQVRTPEGWNRLRATHPELGPCPDLQQGIVVGLASCLGSPLSGRWPIRIEQAQVHDGAILLTAHFESGSYHPDGTTYVDLAYVPNGRQVLVIDINSVRYYPD